MRLLDAHLIRTLHISLLYISLFLTGHYSMNILTRRRRQLGIGLLKFLAGDRESPLQVFRWQAGWQTIGEGGSHPLTLLISTCGRWVYHVWSMQVAVTENPYHFTTNMK